MCYGNDWYVYRYRKWILNVVAMMPKTQTENHVSWRRTKCQRGLSRMNRKWVFKMHTHKQTCLSDLLSVGIWCMCFTGFQQPCKNFFICLKSVSSWQTVFIILLTNGKLLVLFECKSAGISWQNSLGNITAFSTIIMSATAVFLHLFPPGKVTTFFNTKIIFLAAVCLHLFTPATGESYRFLT